MPQPHRSRLAGALLVQTGIVSCGCAIAVARTLRDATGGVIQVPRLWWVERGENLRRVENCRQPTSDRYAIRRWSG